MMTPDRAAIEIRDAMENPDHSYIVISQPDPDKKEPLYLTIKPGFIVAVRALLEGYSAAVECIPKKCVNCGRRKGWDTCKEAAFVSDGEECLSFQWRGPEPGEEGEDDTGRSGTNGIK